MAELKTSPLIVVAGHDPNGPTDLFTQNLLKYRGDRHVLIIEPGTSREYKPSQPEPVIRSTGHNLANIHQQIRAFTITHGPASVMLNAHGSPDGDFGYADFRNAGKNHDTSIQYWALLRGLPAGKVPSVLVLGCYGGSVFRTPPADVPAGTNVYAVSGMNNTVLGLTTDRLPEKTLGVTSFTPEGAFLGMMLTSIEQRYNLMGKVSPQDVLANGFLVGGPQGGYVDLAKKVYERSRTGRPYAPETIATVATLYNARAAQEVKRFQWLVDSFKNGSTFMLESKPQFERDVAYYQPDVARRRLDEVAAGIARGDALAMGSEFDMRNSHEHGLAIALEYQQYLRDQALVGSAIHSAKPASHLHSSPKAGH